MSNSVQVTVNQIGPSASEGTAREHTTVMDRPTAKGGENRGAMGGAPVDGVGRVFYEQPVGRHSEPGGGGVERQDDDFRNPGKFAPAFFGR